MNIWGGAFNNDNPTERDMKIVHLYSNIEHMHGAPKWLMAFASELKNRGHDSAIYCPKLYIPRPYWLTAPIYPLQEGDRENGLRRRGRVMRLIDVYFGVWRLLRQLPPSADFVVLHAEPTVPLIPFIKRKYPSALVIYYCYQPPREIYDLWDQVKVRFNPLFRLVLQAGLPVIKWLDRKLVRSAHAVFVWSKEYREYAYRIYGELNYVLIPAGVDFRMFQLSQAMVKRRIRELKRGCKHLLLMNSALIEKKNISSLIRLLARLRENDVDVSVIIIGEGPLKESLQDLAEQMKISDHFLLTGKVSQEDLPYYYFAADILYFLEDDGAWTMSIIEAGASCIPVIVAPGGSMPTLVQDGKTGHILSDSYDSDELFEKTLRLLNNENERRTMGDNNYRHCTQFSLQKSVDIFLETVKQHEGER